MSVGSRTLPRAEAVASEFGIPRAVDSYEQVLEDPSVNAVYIGLPNTLHAAWILRALEAGKAVLCDKPMTVTADEAAAVLQASRSTGLPVMEGLMYRFHPQNAHVREVIQSGAIGSVREVRVYNAFRLIDTIRPDNIRLTDGAGAGSLMDMGPYVISATRMLFDSEPISAIGRWDMDRTLGVDVGFAGVLEYSDTRFAPISWSFRTGDGGGYVVVGSEAILEVPRAFIPGGAGQVEETLMITVDKTSRRFETQFAPANQYALAIDEFSAAVAEGRRPLYDADDAYRQARAMDLVRDTQEAASLPEAHETARS